MANSRLKDLTGQRFGRLTVIGLGPKPDGRTCAYWMCVCDCGGTPKRAIPAGELRRGSVSSCGCLKSELMKEEGRKRLYKHGYAGKHNQGTTVTPTYRSWRSMHNRCKNPEKIYYAGRGITVCDRWADFEKFLADMGERAVGKTLDRFPDGSGNYEPGNCRWATPKEQAANRRRPIVRSAHV